MKKNYRLFFIGLLIFCGACVKPYYDTRVGRKKQKYYNDIQFGHDAHPKKTW